MKNIVRSFIICFSIIYSQDTFNESSPCSDRTITFARKFGVKALPVKDLPRYFKASKICRKKGGETLIDQIQINEYNRDFEQSKYMSSWTSTYGMCVTAIIFYFFVGLVTVVK